MVNSPDTEEYWATKADNLDSDNLLWKQYNSYRAISFPRELKDGRFLG